MANASSALRRGEIGTLERISRWRTGGGAAFAGAALHSYEVSAVAVWGGGEGNGKWLWFEGIRGVKKSWLACDWI